MLEGDRFAILRSSVYLELGRFPEAVASYQRILNQDPDLLPPLLDAGNAARLAGDLDQAVWYHERLLERLNRSGNTPDTPK